MKNKDSLLKELQTGFPVAPDPFGIIAQRLGVSTHDIIETLETALAEGTVREFGPVFNPQKLGYVSTLVASEVESDHIHSCASALAPIAEITHNYLRNHTLNLWFTIIAENRERIDTVIEKVGALPGVNRILDLPASRLFKISAVWGKDQPPSAVDQTPSEPPLFDKFSRNLVRALQEEFPVVPEPFAVIAQRARVSEHDVLDTVESWVANGIIRRFGARLNHRSVGYTVNMLVAWSGENVESWGEKFAAMKAVSHCYLRTPAPDWPFELYTMLHARSEHEMDSQIASMSDSAPGLSLVRLRSLRELKKTGMKYFMENEA